MITLDFSPEKQALLEQVSHLADIEVTDFIKENIYQDALDMLEPAQVWQVNDEQMQVIATGLNDETPANDELKALLSLVK